METAIPSGSARRRKCGGTAQKYDIKIVFFAVIRTAFKSLLMLFN
jgi:hypothetical protein